MNPKAIRYPLAAIALVAIFLSFLFNRFLPAQDAWFANYADLMRGGRLPYRDFYCFIQPLPLLIARAIVALAGDHLIAFRIYAVVERLALTLATYGMLRQAFGRFASLVGTVAAMVLLTSSYDDAFFSYFVTCTLFSVVAMSALARALRNNRAGWFITGGVLLGLAFFTKQSSGGLLGVAFFGVIVWTGGSVRAVWQRLMHVGSGFSAVGLVILLGLTAYGLTNDYIHDVYLNALGQKGGAGSVLTGFWSRLDLVPYLVAVGVGAALLILLAVTRQLGPVRAPDDNPALFLATLMLFLAALMAPVIFNTTIVPWLIATRVYVVLLFVIPLTFYATLALLLFFAARSRRRTGSGHASLLVLAAGSMSALVASGMSYQVMPGALLPAIGVCLAYALDFLAGRAWLRAVFVALALFVVFIAATKKYLSTYWWFGWEDTSLHPTGHSQLPQLAGFNLDPAEIAIYERAVALIEAHAGPGDTVFTFPNCPLFNVLTGHLQPTFAPVHYPDVCPDGLQRRDAAWLRAHPPRVIVWLHAPPGDEAVLERSFRTGPDNGYREMLATLGALTGGGSYERVEAPLYNNESFPLEIWVRR